MAPIVPDTVPVPALRHGVPGLVSGTGMLEIRWPSGQVDTIKDVKPNQLIVVEEGKGIVRTQTFEVAKKAGKG